MTEIFDDEESIKQERMNSLDYLNRVIGIKHIPQTIIEAIWKAPSSQSAMKVAHDYANLKILQNSGSLPENVDPELQSIAHI